MGQYYRALLIHGKDSAYFFDPHSVDALYKLMEHSWVGNTFVNAVMFEIQDNPMRVAWIGDYCNGVFKDNLGKGGGFITSEEQFFGLCGKVWGDKTEGEVSKIAIPSGEIPRYLINNTKKVYIDMKAYKETGVFDENGDVWCIAPLPLLTAVGNGEGGGDYKGENMELVGSWAFDELFTSSRKPGNKYWPITVSFKE